MRCKSCNAIMEPDEIIWYEEYLTHEELCSRCLDIMHELEDEEDDERSCLDNILVRDDCDWDMAITPPWEGKSQWED